MVQGAVVVTVGDEQALLAARISDLMQQESKFLLLLERLGEHPELPRGFRRRR
jgi:hypothetical protein